AVAVAEVGVLAALNRGLPRGEQSARHTRRRAGERRTVANLAEAWYRDGGQDPDDRDRDQQFRQAVAGFRAFVAEPHQCSSGNWERTTEEGGARRDGAIGSNCLPDELA